MTHKMRAKPHLREQPWLLIFLLLAQETAVSLSCKEVVWHTALIKRSACAVRKVPGLENQPGELCLSCNLAAKLQPSKATLLPFLLGKTLAGDITWCMKCLGSPSQKAEVVSLLALQTPGQCENWSRKLSKKALKFKSTVHIKCSSAQNSCSALNGDCSTAGISPVPLHEAIWALHYSGVSGCSSMENVVSRQCVPIPHISSKVEDSKYGPWQT